MTTSTDLGCPQRHRCRQSSWREHFRRERNRRRVRVSATATASTIQTKSSTSIVRARTNIYFFLQLELELDRRSWIVRIDEIEKHSVRIDYRLRARTSTGPGKQFDNCSSSYRPVSSRPVCEVMSWYLTRVHLTAAS